MPTELLVAIAAAGFVTFVVVTVSAGREGQRSARRGWRSHLITASLIAVIVGGFQALEQSHLSKQAHGLWLSGAVTVLFLGLAAISQSCKPPHTQSRIVMLVGAVAVGAIFASLLVFGIDPTGWLYKH